MIGAGAATLAPGAHASPFVSAVPGSNATSVVLNWEAPISPITSVLVRVDGNGPLTACSSGATVVLADTPETTYTDTGLTAGPDVHLRRLRLR